MSTQLMGKKRGMMQLFDEKGHVVPCTVIEIEPNIVTQIKTVETDGYEAVQLGFEKIVTKDSRTAERRLSKPLRGHLAKSKIAPVKHLRETKQNSQNPFELGQELDVSFFEEASYVDVTGTSKGRGYMGVMRKHGFSGMRASHGAGPVHRHAGSTGMRSTPGRCLPGGKRASHMGDIRVTVQNLLVYKVDKERNLLLIKGSVPGPTNGLVLIRPAVKAGATA